MLKDLFKKNIQEPAGSESNPLPEVPEGLWKKCNHCKAPIYTEDVRAAGDICPKCGGYFRMHAWRRIRSVTDENTFEEWDSQMEDGNPLDFPGYRKKLDAQREKTGLSEAVITGKGKIHGYPVVLGVCDARFFMASMGHTVGEKITRAVERATEQKLPVILFACSGGARMQEGIISLMQMAKTAAALKRHSDAGLLYITVLTDPTTGGVTASFAMLGDIILAEPGALIGFAGPRVIEQTIRQKLPEGFQRSEFLLKHGFLDGIVKREHMRDTLGELLRLHTPGKWESRRTQNGKISESCEEPQGKPSSVRLSPWERVQISRSAGRPVGTDYIQGLFTDFQEFHGDRCCGDDPAVVGGIALFRGRPVTVIAQEKGKNTKDNIYRNFGMPSPEGYRKALRLMKQAEKFHRPVICFVDTPGAFCGMEAEERGQGEAIARNLYEMSSLQTPILSVVIGEGGSGGALALAVSDQVWMLENAVYSILSPEGFASILWKDSKKAPEAAKVMKLTAGDLKKMGVIERVISEQQKASQENLGWLCRRLGMYIEEFLDRYENMSVQDLTEGRYQRFRKM